MIEGIAAIHLSVVKSVGVGAVLFQKTGINEDHRLIVDMSDNFLFREIKVKEGATKRHIAMETEAH